MRRLLLVTVAALLLASPAAASAPRLLVRAVPGTQMRLGAPPGWKSIDRTEAVALLNRIATLNPQIAALAQTIASNGSVIKLVSYDPHLSAGFATNANVVAQQAPGTSLASVVALELPLLRQALHPVSLKTSSIRVAGHAAEEVSFEARFNEPSGPTLVSETQVYVIDRGTLYVLTLTTLPRLRATYAATFAAIVDSIGFGQ